MRDKWQIYPEIVQNLMNLHSYLKSCIDNRDLLSFEETLSELEEINEMKTALILTQNVDKFWEESASAIEKLKEKFKYEEAKYI